jgi:hypothetical protein
MGAVHPGVAAAEPGYGPLQSEDIAVAQPAPGRVLSTTSRAIGLEEPGGIGAHAARFVAWSGWKVDVVGALLDERRLGR